VNDECRLLKFSWPIESIAPLRAGMSPLLQFCFTVKCIHLQYDLKLVLDQSYAPSRFARVYFTDSHHPLFKSD
jgi:hypothetical protein